MNRLDQATRTRVIAVMCEGLGVRPTARATGVSVNAIQALIRQVGAACMRLHDEKVRGIQAQRIECDEMHAFCHAKERNVPAAKKGTFGFGDVWLWTGLDADGKLIISWHVGRRGGKDAGIFLSDLEHRVPNRFELNTDAHNAYWAAIGAFWKSHRPSPGVDYARVIKRFGTPSGLWNAQENRYNQPQVIAVTREKICGDPITDRASTSFAERMNLSVRMHTAKARRCTNGHAKKVAMLRYSLAIAFAYYNFCKGHATLGGRTPAQVAELTYRKWTCADLVGLTTT